MILYTMMPQELIFPQDSSVFQQQQMVNYQGVPLIVEKTDNQSYQVIRILSSDPQHYLNANICPGSKISLLNLDR
ncbi:YlzJ-like family protein [Bacillus sp. JJ1764]|uniref:YlzJ-like family protein n=1 Tax=Bacillus sp. JJ1764 TaxID=3122964 RepID=UPI0030007F52